MIKAFTVSILSLFFSFVQITFINENTERYLEKAGLLKFTRAICIKKGTVPGNTGQMGTLSDILNALLVRCLFTWSHSACFPFVFCSCAIFLLLAYVSVCKQ
jgi:hypothetical protein